MKSILIGAVFLFLGIALSPVDTASAAICLAVAAIAVIGIWFELS